MTPNNTEVLGQWAFSAGYSSGRQLLAPGDFLAPGSKNLFIDGEDIVQSFKGFASTISLASNAASIQSFNFDQTHAELVSNSVAKGSVFMLTAGKTMAFIGAGNVALTGVILLDASAVAIAASSALQFLLLRGGSYAGTAANGPFTAGQVAPSAPIVAAVTYGYGVSGPLTNKTKGTVSGAITRVRSATGGESNASEPSAVVSMPTDGGAMRVTLPAAGSGQDRWGIYVSLSGFGSTGPLFFLVEITEASVVLSRTTSADVHCTSGSTTVTSASAAFTAADLGRVIVVTDGANTLNTFITAINSGTSVTVNAAPTYTGTTGIGVITQAVDGVLRSVAVEWTDADLVGAQYAPIDNDPPPAGWFGATLGDTTMVVGCYGDTTTGLAVNSIGNCIAVSRPGFPEAYPADSLLFLPEAPTGILERSSEGYVVIFGLNSMSVVSYTGASGLPLAIQTVWNTTGCANAWNACMVDGKLHVMTGTGLVRMGVDGEPEKEWTQDVAVDLRGYPPASTVLGYDANWKQLMVAGSNQALLFSVVNQKWGAPLDFTAFNTATNADSRSTVTVNGALLTWIGASSAAKLYTFNTGTGSTWTAFTPWRGGLDYTVATYVRGDFRQDVIANPITFSVYKNFSATASRTWTQTVSVAGGNYIFQPPKLNVRNARSLALSVGATSGSGDSGPVLMLLDGFMSEMRV